MKFEFLRKLFNRPTDSSVYEDPKTGNKTWRLNGKLHREDGPANEHADGYREWYRNGKLHREDGPAIEFGPRGYGEKRWYLNGELDRKDGPAIESGFGNKWYRKGKLHREDGPAVERVDGTKEWYLNGNPLTDDEIAAIQERTAKREREHPSLRPPVKTP